MTLRNFASTEYLSPEEFDDLSREFESPHQEDFEIDSQTQERDIQEKYEQTRIKTTIDKSFARWSRSLEKEPKSTPTIVGYESAETFTTSERWGTWVENRNRLEVAKNIPYNLYAFSVEEASAYEKGSSSYQDVIESYSGFFDQAGTIDSDNTMQALISATLIKTYHDVLEDVTENSDLSNISYKMASRIHGKFLEQLNIQIEESLSESNNLPQSLVPFIIETALASTEKLKGEMDEYAGFNKNYENSTSEIYEQGIARLEYFKNGLQSMPKKVHNPPTDEHSGWIFLHTTHGFSEDDHVDAIITSHYPKFPLKGYYTENGGQVGGLLFAGECMEAFCEDQLTSASFDVELGMALQGKWSIDYRIDLLEESANTELLKTMGYKDINEYMEDREPYYRGIHASSLQDAWDRGPGAKNSPSNYSEVWLRDAVPYGLCIDVDLKEYKEDIKMYGSTYNAIALMNSRPDLPVFNIDGQPVDRVEVKKIFEERNAKLKAEYEANRVANRIY